MKPYSSIETVFTRDKTTKKLNFGDLRNSVNDCVITWTISEKIDGTNIRVIYTLGGVEVRGRTDNAQFPSGLQEAVLSKFPPHEKVLDYFTQYRGKELPEAWSVTFYGEGYGAGINKPGSSYRPDKSFRCFDLLLGESWWTSDSVMREICSDLNIPTAPLLGFRGPKFYNTIKTPEDMLSVFMGGISQVAMHDSGNEVKPEGIVAKPKEVLIDTHGHRVMWKLTCREWE